MIPVKELKIIAKARLKDAEALLSTGRYEGSVYLCGYAVELALKARICQVLRWIEFPSTRGDFSNYQSLKTHDLDVLLHFSGKEDRIKKLYLTEWSAVSQWNPESRYKISGSINKMAAQEMIVSTKTLMRIL
jgi:HEPN domain-containing protein